MINYYFLICLYTRTFMQETSKIHVQLRIFRHRIRKKKERTKKDKKKKKKNYSNSSFFFHIFQSRHSANTLIIYFDQFIAFESKATLKSMRNYILATMVTMFAIAKDDIELVLKSTTWQIQRITNRHKLLYVIKYLI